MKVEQRIHSSLRVLMEGRTTLIIAHRLSTISLADRVVLLDNGRIVADGTHAELLARRRSTPRCWPRRPATRRPAEKRQALSTASAWTAWSRAGGVALAPRTGSSRPTTRSSSPRGVRSDVRRRRRPPMGGGGAPGAAQAGLPFGGIPTSCRPASTCSWRRSPTAATGRRLHPAAVGARVEEADAHSLLMEYPGMPRWPPSWSGSSPSSPSSARASSPYAINHGLTPPRTTTSASSS